jgi:hypothetical protein
MRRIAVKRPILSLAALLMLVVMSGLVPTALADDDGDDDDDGGSSTRIVDFTFGSGTAQFAAGQAQFDFNVESGPNGEAVVGSARLRSAFGVEFAGPATCLAVDGNRAVFEVDNQNPLNAFEDVVVFVGDFGAAGANDEFNFHFIIGVADAICPAPAPTDRPQIDGDIVVGDNVLVDRGEDDDDEGDGDGDDEDDDDERDGDDD